MTVEDLADLELCYAPPVGSAKDPVNYAGMVAQHVMEGVVRQTEWNTVEHLVDDPDTIVLDVRNPGEIAKKGPLSSSAVNIPLNDLRDHLDELPKDKHLVVSCASGQRSYYACRVLMRNGFSNVHNLGGPSRHSMQSTRIPQIVLPKHSFRLFVFLVSTSISCSCYNNNKLAQAMPLSFQQLIQCLSNGS
jgi:rhodanese-related sulfurtransferase